MAVSGIRLGPSGSALLLREGKLVACDTESTEKTAICSYDDGTTKVCVLVPCGPLTMAITGIADMPQLTPAVGNEYYDCQEYCESFNVSLELDQDDPCNWSGGEGIGTTPPCYYPPGDPDEGDPAIATNFLEISASVQIQFALQGDGSVQVIVYAAFDMFSDPINDGPAFGDIVIETVEEGECKTFDYRAPNWIVGCEQIDITSDACLKEGAVMTITGV